MELFSPENLIALLTLTALEIVLGIDNIIFIAILVGKLRGEQRRKARVLGLSLAMLMRVALLLTINWIMLLTKPFFSVFSHGFSGRDIILLLGGLFLIVKATLEIHDKIENPEGQEREIKKTPSSFVAVIVQIILIDIVFSLDSVITAVGMSNNVPVMVTAIVIAVFVMMFFAKAIGDFVEEHPTFKMLALAFLLLIGVMLVADSFGKHIDKAYIYFAIGFSLGVEMLNMKSRKKAKR